MADVNQLLRDIWKLTNEMAAMQRAQGVLLRAMIATHPNGVALEKRFVAERERADVDTLYRPIQEEALTVYDTECQKILTAIQASRRP